MKLKRKAASILVTMSMLLVLLVPLAAAADGRISALNVPVVNDTDSQTLGTIKVTVDAGSIKLNDSVVFKITGGYDFGDPFSEDPASATVANRVYVPARVGADANGIAPGNIEVNVIDGNDEVKIVAHAAQDLVYDFVFYIYMGDVDVEEGTTDDNTVTFSGPGSTGFPRGAVVNATIETGGLVKLAASGADTSNDDFDFELRIEETIAGSLASGNETLKFNLPAGYEWTTPNGYINTFASLWGQGVVLQFRTDEEELIIDLLDAASPADLETTVPSAWNISRYDDGDTETDPNPYLLQFTVADETLVKAGDIIAKVSGESSTNVSTLKAGTYSDFGAGASAKDTPAVYAGFDEQEIGDLVITEDKANTLVENRTVTLTLPANARFQQVYEASLPEPDLEPADLSDFNEDESLSLEFDGFTGTDRRTAKFTVTSASSGVATINLEDVEVALEAGVTGDLAVTLGGSAGLTGEVVVAKVGSPITAAAVSVPNVTIGLGGQAGGDFTITEAAAKVIGKDGKEIVLKLPGGVVFTTTPRVEVTAGDLKIGNVRRTGSDQSVIFDVVAQSTGPSTITVTGVVLTLDRTVAEGDVTLKVMGAAVVETNTFDGWTSSDFAAKFAVAKVVTPAPGETKYTTIFTIGSTTYTVNGVDFTMDVAPFIDENDRTMLPIRFAANSAGVSDNSISWNQADQSVILVKGDRIVKLVVGDSTMTINGVPFEMDTVPVNVDPGRVMLPIRAVAQALGADVAWDAATRTVTITQTAAVQ